MANSGIEIPIMDMMTVSRLSFFIRNICKYYNYRLIIVMIDMGNLGTMMAAQKAR
jgi:hypothetical protein